MDLLGNIGNNQLGDPETAYIQDTWFAFWDLIYFPFPFFQVGSSLSTYKSLTGVVYLMRYIQPAMQYCQSSPFPTSMDIWWLLVTTNMRYKDLGTSSFNLKISLSLLASSYKDKWPWRMIYSSKNRQLYHLLRNDQFRLSQRYQR